MHPISKQNRLVAWLSHNEQLRLAALLMVSISPVVILMLLLQAKNSHSLAGYLMLLVSGVFVCGLVYRLRTPLLYTVGILAYDVALLILLARVDALAIVLAVLEMSILTAICILVVRHFHWSEQDRQPFRMQAERKQHQLLATAFDVKDRTEVLPALDVLRRSETYFRSLIENALDIVAIIDPDGSLRYYSPSVERVLGYAPRDTELQTIFDVIHPEDHAKLQAVFTATHFRSVVTPIECRVLHRDGSWRTLEVIGTNLIRDPIVAGFVVNARDITERKQTEESLRQHTQAMTALVNASITITGAADMDTMLTALTDLTKAIFPDANRVSVQLVDPERQSLQTRHASAGLVRSDELITFQPQRGIAGYAYAERRVINVPDVLMDERYIKRPGEETPPYRSLLVAPLAAGEKIWGTLSMSHVRTNAFSPRDEAILEMLARQAAVVIDKLHLFKAERDQRLLAEALRDTAAALNSAMSLDEVLDQILIDLERVVAHNVANIMLLDPGGKVRLVRLRGYRELGLEDYAHAIKFDLETFATLRQVFETRQPLIISDVREYGDWVVAEEFAWIRSFMSAPILDSSGQVIGFLNMDSSQIGAFSQVDVEKIGSFANQAGLAIAKARLFESEQRQREIAETLRDIGLVLTSSMQRGDLLLRFLEQMARVVAYDAAGIWLLAEDGTKRLAQGVGYERFGVAQQLQEVVYHPDSDWLFQQLNATRRTMVIADTDGADWIPQGFEWMKSWACVPIWVRGKLYGHIALDHTQPGYYSAAHVPVLEALAAQLSIVLENALLFAQVQQHASELEQRVAERTAELERQRTQLQTILEVMDEGVIYAEYKQGAAQAVTRYVNPSLCRMTGYSAEEIVAQPIREFRKRLLAPADFEAFEHVVTNAIEEARRAGRAKWAGELKVMTKSGHIIDTMLTTAMVCIAETQLFWSVAVLRDISQEKLLQRQKERFVANAAHELRTPLSNLVTRVYLLRNQPNSWQEHVAAIESTTNRLSHLAQDLIDVTRYQRGVISVFPRHVDLVRLVHEVVAVQQTAASLKHIQINTSFAHDQIIVNIDPDRFAQVITNLIVNSISYSPEGTEITVAITETASTVRLSVKDAGIGIPAEYHQMIFEPFFRASEGKVSGTGLGLTICKEIVELHGGRIWVESNTDRGSSFHVSLEQERQPAGPEN